VTETHFPISLKHKDISKSDCENLFDILCRAVASLNPNNLGRMTVDKASLMKIRVFGHDREPVSQSVIPNYLIIGPFQSNVTHVNRARKKTRERLDQTRR